MPKTTLDKHSLSRRETLKALLASGGVLAFAKLPKRWETPIVTVGILPPFAQISPSLGVPPLTSNCRLTGPLGACDPGGGQAGNLYTITCDYSDPDGNVLANQAQVRTTFVYPAGQTSTLQETLDPINITGNGTTGTITLPLCIGFNGQSAVTLTLAILDANGLQSNTETVLIPAP